MTYDCDMKYSSARDAHGTPLITPKEAALGCWGIAICVALLAFSEWTNPTTAPFAGRSAWLYRVAAELLGHKGPAIAWLTFSALMILIGALAWIGAKRVAR